MTSVINVLGISGSLRKGSLNTAALRAAVELAPADMKITFAEIGDLPLYNEDVREQGYPETVQRVREQVRVADAILFVTPEYNYSIPGVLKNAIDWISRPPEQPFAGKPAAIMGVSPALLGTARAQYHLRQVGVYLDLLFLNKPEVMIGSATTRFDADGNLTDAATREHVQKQLIALREWTLALQKSKK